MPMINAVHDAPINADEGLKFCFGSMLQIFDEPKLSGAIFSFFDKSQK